MRLNWPSHISAQEERGANRWEECTTNTGVEKGRLYSRQWRHLNIVVASSGQAPFLTPAPAPALSLSCVLRAGSSDLLITPHTIKKYVVLRNRSRAFFGGSCNRTFGSATFFTRNLCFALTTSQNIWKFNFWGNQILTYLHLTFLNPLLRLFTYANSILLAFTNFHYMLDKDRVKYETVFRECVCGGCRPKAPWMPFWVSLSYFQCQKG